ncbi:hypothetical protein [Streptomyces sp. HB132]|nr:hypothetical protein [Streptomyces sp. HB132]MBM7442362.1 hypothetical protein [Streptomyces sp. HB132]
MSSVPRTVPAPRDAGPAAGGGVPAPAGHRVLSADGSAPERVVA